uniref:Transcription initiation factor IIB n=1 Tax=Pithovirus LCPAC404 TaxID=2506597 RepID=A0A481ZEB3_9VIRU|nr:MAG: transcription initiation factor IIB [Pithovirus LCPAC404]
MEDNDLPRETEYEGEEQCYENAEDEEKYYENREDGQYSKLHIYSNLKKDKCPIEFGDIPIRDDVRKAAKIICRKLVEKTAAKRINRLKHLKFVCVYYAYGELGIVEQPQDIALMVGITKKEMFKAIQTHSELETGFRPKNIKATPEALLERYCEKLELNDHKSDIINIAKRILAKDLTMNDDRMPQVVAGGFLLYYLKINGIIINDEKPELTASKITYKSVETIKSMYKNIYRIDNS